MNGDPTARILEALLASLPPTNDPVREVLVGAYWTMVNTGLATTFRDRDPQHGDACGSLPDAGVLHHKTARELASYVRSEHPVAMSIGMAAINSMLDLNESRCTNRGAFDLLAEKGRGRNVAVVGHFPFVPKLREVAKELWVLEQRPRPGDLPAHEATRILPQCEVVCLTGTSLMNGTLDDLLALCRDAYVVLTGPSSPLSPLLFEFGIDAICGARVADPAAVSPFIIQGASFKQLHSHGVRLITLEREIAAKPL
jgi:hypothetical protein